MVSIDQSFIATRSKVYIGGRNPKAPNFKEEASIKCSSVSMGQGSTPGSARLQQYFPSADQTRPPDERMYTADEVFDYVDEDWQPKTFGPDAEGKTVKVSAIRSTGGGLEIETTIFIGVITGWEIVAGQGPTFLSITAEDYRLPTGKMPFHGAVIGRILSEGTHSIGFWLASALVPFNIQGRPNLWADREFLPPLFAPPEVLIGEVTDESEEQNAIHWNLFDIFDYLNIVYDSASVFFDLKPADDLGSVDTWFGPIVISQLAETRLRDDAVSPAELDLTGRSFTECLDLIFSRANRVGWSVTYDGTDTPIINVYATDNDLDSGIDIQFEKRFRLRHNDPSSNVRSFNLGLNARNNVNQAKVIGRNDRYQSTFSTINLNDDFFPIKIGWTEQDERDFLTNKADNREDVIKTPLFTAVYNRYVIPEDFDWSQIVETPDGKPETAYFETSRPFLPQLLHVTRGLFDGTNEPAATPVFIQRGIFATVDPLFRKSDILPPEVGVKHIEVLDRIIGKGGIEFTGARETGLTYWRDSETTDESDVRTQGTTESPYTWNGKTDSEENERHEIRFTMAFEVDSRIFIVREIEQEGGLLPHEKSSILIVGDYRNDFEKHARYLINDDGNIRIKDAKEVFDTGMVVTVRERIDVKNDDERAGNRAQSELDRLNRSQRQGSITTLALDPGLQPGQNAKFELGQGLGPLIEFDLGPINSVVHDFEAQSTTVVANG